jgi:hypothetical protein
MRLQLRLIIWIPAFAYAGFLLSGGSFLSPPAQIFTAVFFGALLGFLFACVFTIRQHRRLARKHS